MSALTLDEKNIKATNGKTKKKNKQIIGMGAVFSFTGYWQISHSTILWFPPPTWQSQIVQNWLLKTFLITVLS